MGIWKTFCNWLGFEDEESIPAIQAGIEDTPVQTNNRFNFKNNKSMKTVIYEPEMFEETPAMASQLKNGSQVIVRFNSVSPEVSQRMIDFLAGVVCSLNGQSQKLGNNIFMFVPSNVEISQDLKIAKPRINMAN